MYCRAFIGGMGYGVWLTAELELHDTVYVGADVHPADDYNAEDAEEEGAHQCLDHDGRQPCPPMGEEGRERPLPECVEREQQQCEGDDVYLFGAEEGHMQPAPKEQQQGHEIDDIGQQGGTGRARHPHQRYEPDVEPDGRGGEQRDEEERVGVVLGGLKFDFFF